MFPCGSCGDPGCSHITWDVSQEGTDVTVRMGGWKEPLGDGLYRLPYDAYVAGIVRFFDDFIATMGAKNVHRFEREQTYNDGLPTLTDFEDLQADLLSRLWKWP